MTYAQILAMPISDSAKLELIAATKKGAAKPAPVSGVATPSKRTVTVVEPGPVAAEVKVPNTIDTPDLRVEFYMAPPAKYPNSAPYLHITTTDKSLPVGKNSMTNGVKVVQFFVKLAQNPVYRDAILAL